MIGKINNPECAVISIDPDLNGLIRKSISFKLIVTDRNLVLLKEGREYEVISPSGESEISIKIFSVSDEYIKENDVIGSGGDIKKGNHLSYSPDQGVFATLFMGPEIFLELYNDIKRKIIPKSFTFEFFNFGFSSSCIREDDSNQIIWDITNNKIINVWGISFTY